jgi:hypothetical protein
VLERANWAAGWMFARPNMIFVVERATFGSQAMFARPDRSLGGTAVGERAGEGFIDTAASD